VISTVTSACGSFFQFFPTGFCCSPVFSSIDPH
jgi:hypothetical protein